MIVYDNRFNGNEIYVLALLLGGFALFAFSRKIFPARDTLLLLLYGTFIGLLLDHTISIKPFDFYDVNDSSAFELMDFCTYLMYGPFEYFFIYLYRRLNIGKARALLYVLLWALFSMLPELVGIRLGVYHYKHGYMIYLSLPIYILVLSANILLYHCIVRLRGKADGPEPGEKKPYAECRGKDTP